MPRMDMSKYLGSKSIVMPGSMFGGDPFANDPFFADSGFGRMD